MTRTKAEEPASYKRNHLTGTSHHSLAGKTDEALAVAAQKGDPCAFAELYRRYKPIFFSYAQKKLGAEAEDALQTVFSSIYQGLQQYRGPVFFSWAYRILVNRVTDELRKKKRQKELLSTMSDQSPHMNRQEETPEENLVALRVGQRIQGALDTLPVSQKTVFVLARVGGLDYGEISTLLDIPVGTVKSRMFAAVKTLFSKGEEQ